MLRQYKAVTAAKDWLMRPINRLIRRTNIKLAFWIVRSRRRRTYFALSLWPYAMTVIAIVPAFWHVPSNTSRALFWVSKGSALLLAVLVLAEAVSARRRRWERLRRA